MIHGIEEVRAERVPGRESASSLFCGMGRPPNHLRHDVSQVSGQVRARSRANSHTGGTGPRLKPTKYLFDSLMMGATLPHRMSGICQKVPG